MMIRSCHDEQQSYSCKLEIWCHMVGSCAMNIWQHVNVGTVHCVNGFVILQSFSDFGADSLTAQLHPLEILFFFWSWHEERVPDSAPISHWDAQPRIHCSQLAFRLSPQECSCFPFVLFSWNQLFTVQAVVLSQLWLIGHPGLLAPVYRFRLLILCCTSNTCKACFPLKLCWSVMPSIETQLDRQTILAWTNLQLPFSNAPCTGKTLNWHMHVWQQPGALSWGF